MDLLNSNNKIRYDWKGDYLGFTIGGIHSSSLGIVRISDSDRYTEELVPVFSDRIATVSGLDSTYYFGTDYTQKKFTIKFAFEHLTDGQIRKLKQVFSKKEPQNLIFDEMPYKVYNVKIDGQPQISYLCFDENYERIYKGDGVVNFIAYSPFARSRFKYLEDYNIHNIPEWGGSQDNIQDWINSSGIISKNSQIELSDGIHTWIGKIDQPKNEEADEIKFFPTLLHNPSDKKVFPKIAVVLDRSSITDNLNLGDFGFKITKENELISQLTLNHKLIPNDLLGFVIDCERQLIFALDIIPESNDSSTWIYDNTKIYNNLIYSGNFLSIPNCNFKDGIIISGIINEHLFENLFIDYKYLYY